MTKRSARTRNAARTLVAHAAIGFCVTASIASTGCRSGRPSLNLFSMRGEPSAEMLAGTGPTATYPKPPSANATPNAIASVAGGTAPAKPSTPGTSPANMYAGTSNPGLPTVNSTPGVPSTPTAPASNPYASLAAQNNTTASSNSSLPPASYALPGSGTPSTPVSYAAASANGYGVPAQPAANTQPTPRPTAMPPISVPSTSAPAGPEALAGKSSSQPSTNGFTLPDSDIGSVASAPANKSTGSAFTLPGDFAAPSGNTTASNSVTDKPSDNTASSAIGLPEGIAGSISSAKDAVASAASKATQTTADAAAKAASTIGGAASYQTASGATNTGTVKPTGYSPGSTGSSSGYPSSSMMR
ncbi:hypothetical protein [Rhodopirellula halodulae]|uniref:hypothetical protein n=1 Tax=Rhodopirellula halodulae TaxID=2894198 RepID=UPI001E5C6BF5|nr:hypothetical protein [Rhodopirellula sp. JC737]MCC9658558.1 hypothetical protein [Rhodopirellula sp. JC737]